MARQKKVMSPPANAGAAPWLTSAPRHVCSRCMGSRYYRVSCLILSRLHILVFLLARCSFPVRTWGRERQKEDDGKIGKEKVKRRERERERDRKEGGRYIRRITYIYVYIQYYIHSLECMIRREVELMVKLLAHHLVLSRLFCSSLLSPAYWSDSSRE